MKLILKDVKIYGYDKSICRTFVNEGKETKQYSVALYISEEQKAQIDTWIFDKVLTNQDGDFIFYGKSKQPIPIFDTEAKHIVEPVNEVFLADVSILIDEFTDKATGETIRYSKCLGIKYISKVENEEAKVFVAKKEYNTFDDIFSDEEEINLPATPTAASDKVNPLELDPLNVAATDGTDDLPFN